MIKLFSKIFGGLGGNIGNIALLLLAGAIAFFGWSYGNRGQKVKSLTAELLSAKRSEAHWNKKSDSLALVIMDIQDKVRQDSAYHQKTIADFQSIIKAVREQQKQAEKERNEALSGILCWKVGLFGKKKLVKCDEL